MKEFILQNKPNERDNVQDITQTVFYKMNELVINFFDEKIENELDKKFEQGAIDFKLFIFEQYDYILLNNKKENKQYQKNYFKLMNKYLKNEISEIGGNKYFLIMLSQISSNNNNIDRQPSELNFLAFNEFMKCLNDNLQRIKEIWDININHRQEKNLIKNSFEILYSYSYYILLSIKWIYNKQNNNAIQNNINLYNNSNVYNYISDINKQKNIFIDNMPKVFDFFKKLETEKKNEKSDKVDNYKNFILEKFLSLFLQIIYLFIRMKSLITKDEAELICQSCCFMMKYATSSNLVDNILNLFWELINYCGRSTSEEDQNSVNCLYDEMHKNWEKYFDFEIYLKNKYLSETKINKVLTIFIRLYTYIFNGCAGRNKMNGHQFLLLKNLLKSVEENEYKIFIKLIQRINDNEVSIENKIYIILMIYDFFNWYYTQQKLIEFDLVYFIINELNNFLYTLYILHKDNDIAIFLKEEKQIEKDYTQKNVFEIKKEHNAKKINLNGALYNITKGKYDKYIYIKDLKYFKEILKSSSNSQHSLLDIIQLVIYFFKEILNKNTLEKKIKIYYLDKISNILCKFFFYYFFLYEKFKVNHQSHEQNDYISFILYKYIKELYSESNNDLFFIVFKKLMPYIYSIYKHCLKICPTKPCIIQKLFHFIFKNIKDQNIKENLFQIYFEFFSEKIYLMGNLKDSFDNISNNAGLNESINYITILKTLNIFDNISHFDFFFKNVIMPLIIDILYLSKNSEYFGNYIYILRCFFKNMKAINLNTREKKKLIEDFNNEINYIIYPIFKYLINLKSKSPFFNDMISVIITTMPLKQTFINENPDLIFPSLIDNLLTDSNNKELNLSNLENWISLFYVKNPESVLPFFKKSLPEISDFLVDNLTRPVSKNLWFESLKWLSKTGGSGRNFFLEKKLISKTCPLQILCMKLIEENNINNNNSKKNKNMNLILDYIIDIDIDTCLNWRNTLVNKKILNDSDKILIKAFIDIFKNCLSAFFHEKIDYNYILQIKKNILEKKYKFNEEEFNSVFSFRQMNEKNSKIKLNSIFRKKEHFCIGKIITGYILLTSSFTEIENLKEDKYFIENDLMKFICDYFIMILLTKEKNNKNIFLFEQDPMYLLDELTQFLFTNHPTIIKNTNVQLSDYSIKIINYIIETLNNFFDNDIDVIKNLEIIDVIYYKFLNCCYYNDVNKIDIGLILMKILVDKFDKRINFKYLKYFFKSISKITLNYNNISKILFKKGCNNLVQLIESLINTYITPDINYFSLDENDFEKNDNNLLKDNFIMLFEFIKYSFDDIIDKINSENNYTREYTFYFIEKITGKNIYLKNMLPILFQLDINNLTIKDFLKYYKETNNEINYGQILLNINNKDNIDMIPININKKKKYILPNFNEKKIFNKLDTILNALSYKLSIRENKFNNLISNSNALNNIFKLSPSLIKEHINFDKAELYINMIRGLYHNILINYFNYTYVCLYIKNSNENNLVRYTHLFMEKLLGEKNIEFNYEINDEQGKKILIKNEISDNDIKYIEKYLKDNYRSFSFLNDINNRYNIIEEIFEYLNMKINLIFNYIQLLNNIFGKYSNYFFQEKTIKVEFINEYNKYKIKTTKLIFLHILNIQNEKIKKQCSAYLKNILSNEEKIKEEIFNEYKEYIIKMIEDINLEEIKKSNCALNYEMKKGLQPENINSLLIICKVLNLNNDINIKNKIIQNLKHFENILEEKIENDQLILSFGFISIFLYIDISNNEDIVYRIFNLILLMIKSSLINPDKKLLNLNQIIYKKKVIKLITKYRKNFAKYIIEKSNDIYENKNIINLIKIILVEDNSYIINECLFKEITNEFKNNIMKNYYNNKIDLIKVSHLIKICQKISQVNKIYLKSTSFLNIIEPYIQFLSKDFSENSNTPNNNAKKVFKNWIKLNIHYIKAFKDKKFSLINLFFCKALPNLSNIEKNKIDKLLVFNISLVNKYKTESDFEKSYKYIMTMFISLDADIIKYFDFFVDNLIIPMTINYYKNKHFFEQENDNKNKMTSLDEEYLINTLDKLSTGLYKIKFKKEKDEESKYKLIILLIILYKEYISHKDKLINDDRIKKIFYTIQSMLDYSPCYENKNQLGLWRIYLFLAICIFSEQDKREQEKNLEIIFNFNRRLNEDFNDVQNLIYELVLSNSKKEESISHIFTYTIKDNPFNGVFFFKLFLKYPYMINNIGDKFIRDILNCIYKLREISKFVEKKKNLFVQIIGMVILYIKNKRIKNNIEPDLENFTFHISYKVYKSLLLYLKEKDPEIDDTFQKILFYIRELIDTKTNLISEIRVEDITKINYIHAHVSFMRICFFYFGFNSLMKNSENIKFFFLLNRYIIDKKVNHLIFNDYSIIFRLLIDLDTFFEINQKEKPEDIYIIEYKKNLFNEIKEQIKDKTNINNKFVHFDLKNYIQSINSQINLLKLNEHFENITKKVFDYLRSNHLYPDLNLQNRVPPSLNTTLPSTDAQPRGQQIQQQIISPDKWLDTFQIYEIKNFIFCRKFYDEFYKSIISMITAIENCKVKDINLNELKSDLDNFNKTKKENMDIIYYSTFAFFENFYYFTLYFFKEYYTLSKKKFLESNLTPKEQSDYFESTHCFFYSMKNYDKNDINKMRKENIEIIINENENLNKKYAFNLACIYPDIILSSFLFFFQCDEIMENYYSLIIELFLHTYKFLKDVYYESCLVYLIEEIVIRNKIMNKKIEEKNIFIYKFLKIIDQLNSIKSIRTNEKIVIIFVNYLKSLKNNIKEFDFNDKRNSVLNKILKIILYNSAKFYLDKRKIVFDLIKSYIGYDIISYLKWIFTFDDFDLNDVYNYIFFELIPLSVDFLLSFFKQGIPLKLNDYNFSKFKNLSLGNKNMEIDEEENIYDKNGVIKNMVENCNFITKEKKVEDLLNPIHILITFDNSQYKLFKIVFTQLWKTLTMTEKELISVYINKFIYEYTTKQKDRNSMTINLLFETFSECSPIIYIKPIVIQSLIPYQNLGCVNILYLENLLINGIDIPNTYISLINILNSLKENDLSNGLKYFFNENKKIKNAYAELQANNYINAENIFYECVNKLNEDILKDENNINENIYNELSLWDEGLIECYEKSDKWSYIKELGDFSNNKEMVLKSLWFDKKEENLNLLDDYIKSTRFEINNNVNISHIIQIKEIYSMFKPLIEANNDNNNYNVSSICMKCIQNIFKEYNSLYPKNMDNIDNYYYFIFQLVFESWESMNTLNDTLIKIKSRKSINFKDNLLKWRERLPHYCEGYQSLKSILEPRNNLFNILKNLVNSNVVGNPQDWLPFFSDKVWNDMIFMRYTRKLNLVETFYEKKKTFEEEHKDMLKVYPYEIYLKDIECIKFIRNNTYNYEQGINLCDECINKYKTIINENTLDFVNYITNNFIGYKAYFNYKKGNIIEAHNLFIQASVFKNKESNNYRIYLDWAEMCEEITRLISDDEESEIWFENTIHNFIYSIIYKLEKAKFVLPRMISFIKEIENKNIKNKFNEDLDEIPVWIWIFWLPVLFENFNFYENNEQKNDFYFYILKKVAKEYKQMFYYSYNVYNKIILDKKNLKTEYANEKYEELYKIVTSENKYNNIIDKINIIINEFIKKEEKNKITPLNSILTLAEKMTYLKKNIKQVKDFFISMKKLLSKFNDLSNFTEEISNLLNQPDVTRNQLRDFVIKKKNYLHNLIVTENNYKELQNLFEDKIYNIDFSQIEVPGYFSNKIKEPTEQNILYITKFENQYSQKFINDSRINMLIKCNNEKSIYFILEKQNAENNIDNKIYLMQIIFNFIFEKNIETYKRKIKFLIPIKYFISSKLKIIEEDINYQYKMDDIYEYCLQKRGYDPHISYQIFEEEGIKNNFDPNYLYFSEMNNQKVFEKMCTILPQDSFKIFINKFNLSGEDILLFRKQFTVSYSINNLMNFIFNEDIFLKNISFNKENGLCIFNIDLSKFPENDYKDLLEQKNSITLRLTKNISYFLCPTSIYGMIPGIFYFSSKALLNKIKVVKSLFKICLDNEKITNNYINKFKYLINDIDDNNDIINGEENIGMKNIYELIENSWNDDKLKKKSIDFDAWF